MRSVAYRVVVARKPLEPGGIWAPAEVVLGAGAAQRPGAFLGEVLPPVFELVEAPVVRASKDVLRTFSFQDVAIEQIEDIFNDKVIYSELRAGRDGEGVLHRAAESSLRERRRRRPTRQPTPPVAALQRARRSTT